MNTSGEAAEQVVRFTLEGGETVLKLTGTAAKEIALLIAAALKSAGKSGDGKTKLKSKGQVRLESMLKSGEALEVFSVKEIDLKDFAKGAKGYGIVYALIRDKSNALGKDGLCDVMVRAADAPRINRLVERLDLAAVSRAQIEAEVVPEKAEQAPEAPERGEGDVDTLLDDLLGSDEGKAKEEAEKDAPENPEAARTAESRPSEPISPSRSESERGTSRRERGKEADAPARDGEGKPAPAGDAKDGRAAKETDGKPSVRRELREIREARRKEADAPAPARDAGNRAEPARTGGAAKTKASKPKER
jgi:hypothetical protein